MKKLSALTLMIFPWVLVCGVPLQAAVDVPTGGSILAHWNQVCSVAANRQLEVLTTDGTLVAGFCSLVDADTLALNTPGFSPVQIRRADITRLRLRTAKGHHLESLWQGIHHNLTDGPVVGPPSYMLLVLVSVPLEVAYGVVATPFCAVGDVKAALSRDREITLLADSSTPTPQTAAPTH